MPAVVDEMYVLVGELHRLRISDPGLLAMTEDTAPATADAHGDESRMTRTT